MAFGKALSLLKQDKVKALKGTHLFANLEEPGLSELAGVTRVVRLKRGEILFMADEPAERMFVIVSGCIRAFRVNAKGREQIIHIERAGATLAEIPVFDDGPYPATAGAEEDSLLLSLGRDDFKKICYRHPEVAWAALRILSERLRRHAELVNELSLHDVGPRLAKFLLGEMQRKGQEHKDGISFKTQLTNQQLASRIGSVREVVSRMLTRLEKDGMIRLDGHTNGTSGYDIVIVDLMALKDYAEGL
jgi:CRP/FNR family transcriptional regulator